MTIPRFLAVCAVLAAFAAFPSRAPAEEEESTEEAAAQDADQAPTTTTTEAAAPSAEPVPVKKATRGYRQPARPAAARRDDEGGGGGGGGGAVPRRQPRDSDEGENTYEEPDTPQGKPSMDCDTPPLHHINVHLMGGNGNRFKVDSTPIVCSTGKGTKHERYCQETMGDDNRNCCPVKPEGHPMRVACELALLGTDRSDGVAGPHWSYIGGDGGVERHPDNPFLAFAYGKGIVRACSNVYKVCGEKSYQVPNYGKK